MFDWLRGLACRLRGWLSLGRLDQDFRQELEAHLALLTEENIRRGLPPEEARRDARLRLGGMTQLRETHRELQGLPWIETLAQDVRYALRTLRKNPGFTVVAIFTLALGIGANTAIFTVVNAVLLRPLPYPNPKGLVTWHGNESLLDVDDIRAQSSRFFSAGGAVNPEVMDYTGRAEPLGVHAGYVDAGLFQVLGVAAMLGRTLSPDEDRPGGPRVVVLAYPFWREYLASDPNIVGKTISLSGNRYTVIGVMPAGFAVPEYNLDLLVSLWVVYPEAAAYRGVHFMNSYWRLKPGVTPAQAAAGMAAVDARLAANYPEADKGRHRVPVPLQQWVTGDVRPALWVLFGAVCVVLLIACANFAGLLMARTVTRRREMVIRAALGGGRRRLIRQALTESTLLAVLGGTAGLLLAKWGTGLLVAAKPSALAHLNGISMDPTVLGFGLAVSTLTGLIFGLAPAWNASHADVSETLKQEGGTATASAAKHGFRNVLVAAELALALMMLTAAGLLIKSFARLHSVDPGFNPAHVFSISIQLPVTRYAEIPKQTEFRRGLLERLNSLAEPAYPAVFTPFAQSNEAWRRWMSVVVRLPQSSASLIPAVKGQIWSLDSQIPLNRIQSMDELLGLSLAERRFNMSLLGLFAGMAMILAAVGIYGLLSYSVSQRTHEIGVRVAVGARRRDVLKLVLGQGARLAAVGLAAGVLGALALTRLMASLLFGVTATDPATFATVALLMMAVALLACFVPARRAMRVDPMVALRHE